MHATKAQLQAELDQVLEEEATCCAAAALYDGINNECAMPIFSGYNPHFSRLCKLHARALSLLKKIGDFDEQDNISRQEQSTLSTLDP